MAALHKGEKYYSYIKLHNLRYVYSSTLCYFTRLSKRVKSKNVTLSLRQVKLKPIKKTLQILFSTKKQKSCPPLFMYNISDMHEVYKNVLKWSKVLFNLCLGDSKKNIRVLFEPTKNIYAKIFLQHLCRENNRSEEW